MTQKKSNSDQIFMSIVALVLILLVGVGVTYSWIEEGKTYSVETDKAIEVETDEKTDTLTYGGTITLNPDAAEPELGLIEYDETTNQYQDLVFCPVHSLNGSQFIFPVTDSAGAISSFRHGTTNDIGTKFIKSDFDVKAAKRCFLAFTEKPTITATKNGNSDIDTTAFRILISNGSSTHIFSTSDEVQRTNVATNLDWATSTLTTETFDNYIYNQTTDNKLFEYGENAEGNIRVVIWVDAAAPTEQLEALEGCDIKIDMGLTVVSN